MKKAYTCLLIGCLFIWLDLSIMGINVLPDFVGYILIVIGVYFGEKHQRIQEFIQAKYLGIALSIYCLIYPLFQQFSGIEVWWPLVALTLTANLATIYLFYSLLKAEYLWHPQTGTRQLIFYTGHYPLYLYLLDILHSGLRHFSGSPRSHSSHLFNLYLLYLAGTTNRDRLKGSDFAPF